MPTADIPAAYETTTAGPTLHESARLNMINRDPSQGEGAAGFVGNTVPVIEVEAHGHFFVTAEEARALALRLLEHATILELPRLLLNL
jgi:hypothetical protein